MNDESSGLVPLNDPTINIFLFELINKLFSETDIMEFEETLSVVLNNRYPDLLQKYKPFDVLQSLPDYEVESIIYECVDCVYSKTKFERIVSRVSVSYRKNLYKSYINKIDNSELYS